MGRVAWERGGRLHGPTGRVSRHHLETLGVCPLWLVTWWTAVRIPPGKTRGGIGWPCFGGRGKGCGCSPVVSPHTPRLLGQRMPVCFPHGVCWKQVQRESGRIPHRCPRESQRCRECEAGAQQCQSRTNFPASRPLHLPSPKGEGCNPERARATARNRNF